METRARASGILLHPTSLPGPYGIGDLGPEAFRFADWMAAAGQRLWQVLPLGPVGYGESPYQLYSAFAGNPLLISLDRLVEQGWLRPAELKRKPAFPTAHVDFENVIPWKMSLLRRASDRFEGGAEFDRFESEEAPWLHPFAAFMALREANGGKPWDQWDPALPAAPGDVRFHRFLQFEFFRQWQALRRHCGGHGIRIMGDIPIYVAHNSADVWAHPELFRFDVVSGVPPDYFSATGQLWGNPLYQWDAMAGDGYQWWVRRMRAALRLYDLVRMDHFRGIEAFWEVAATETTAQNGRWVRGPGAALFQAMEAQLGPLPLVAENLGVITPEVEALREQFGFPGMAVLQFAFGCDQQAPGFLPHNYIRRLVAYTGTHDNDTLAGWWHSQGNDSTRTSAQVEEEKARALAYFGTDGRQIHWTMIRTLMASVADTVLFPMQDALGLGSEARMNTPSVPGGNWRWRMAPRALTAKLATRLASWAALYDR